MHRSQRAGLSITAVTALVAGLIGLGVATSPAGATPPVTESASYTTPGHSTFTVPAGVSVVTATVNGAQGGAGTGRHSQAGEGGPGGQIVATVEVTPGAELEVYVGGAGSDTGAGGANGGGTTETSGCARGGGGGGASDVRFGGTALTDRILVAGGGGGGGNGDSMSANDVRPNGGVGGGATPTAGVEPTRGYFGVSAGQPGTATGGGAAGGGMSWRVAPGALGQGGAGESDSCQASGAGGGGYYGGGGGGGMFPEATAGGGGGSSFAGPPAQVVSLADGTRTGDGSVTFEWAAAPTTTTTTTTTTTSTTTLPTTTTTMAPRTPVTAPTTTVPPTTTPPTTVAPRAAGCPARRPYRIYNNSSSRGIGAHLVARCGYRTEWRRVYRTTAAFAVPAEWPKNRVVPQRWWF